MPASTVAATVLGALTLTLGAATAGALEPGDSALATPYESAPGHGPSLSAVCQADGIVIGSHPWDQSNRNFQIWDGASMVVNVTTGAPQYWTRPAGDYRVRYAGTWYDIDGDQCTPFTPATVVHTPPPPVVEVTVPPATTVPEPTPETVPPTTSTVPPTTTTEPPVELVNNPPAPAPTLPETGSNAVPLAVAGASLIVLGAAACRYSRR